MMQLRMHKPAIQVMLCGLRNERWCKLWDLNHLRAKFVRESINKYLYFVSYLHIDTTQVVEIFPQIQQEPTYST